jgi:hypothetical protein
VLNVPGDASIINSTMGINYIVLFFQTELIKKVYNYD